MSVSVKLTGKTSGPLAYVVDQSGNQVPLFSSAAVKKAQSFQSSNGRVSSKQLDALQLLDSTSGFAAKGGISIGPSAASLPTGAGPAASAFAPGGKQAPTQKAVDERLRRLEAKLAQQKPSEDPVMREARKHARAVLKYVALPDEMAGVDSIDIPAVPGNTTSSKLEHFTSALGSVSFGCFNLVVNAPGQTSYALQVNQQNGTPVASATYVVLNMGRSDLAFTVASAGGTSLIGGATTRRLVPGFHLGYVATQATERPTPPVIGEIAPAVGYLWHVVTDGAGNYTLAQTKVSTGVRLAVIGNCNIASPGTVSAVFPVSSITGLTATAGALTITPLIPTTGAPLRSLLMLEGATGSLAGPDLEPSPVLPVSCNMRMESMAGAVQAKYSAFDWSINCGREGPYCDPVPLLGYAAVPYPKSPSTVLLTGRSRQHTMGVVNPDNSIWYAINVASRINGLPNEEPFVVQDLAMCGAQPSVPAPVAQVAVTYQGDPTTTLVPGVVPDCGWNHDYQVSFTYVETSAGQPATTFSLEAYAWVEFSISSEIGLVGRRPLYYPEFEDWLQVISTYPTMACADSFRDFLTGVFRKGKSIALDLTRRVGRAGKEILRDVAVETVLGLIAAA